MSGYNFPCEFCGKMTDDFPELDCCQETIESITTAREIYRAEDDARSEVEACVDQFFLDCNTVSDVTTAKERIVAALRRAR